MAYTVDQIYYIIELIKQNEYPDPTPYMLEITKDTNCSMRNKTNRQFWECVFREINSDANSNSRIFASQLFTDYKTYIPESLLQRISSAASSAASNVYSRLGSIGSTVAAIPRTVASIPRTVASIPRTVASAALKGYQYAYDAGTEAGLREARARQQQGSIRDEPNSTGLVPYYKPGSELEKYADDELEYYPEYKPVYDPRVVPVLSAESTENEKKLIQLYSRLDNLSKVSQAITFLKNRFDEMNRSMPLDPTPDSKSIYYMELSSFYFNLNKLTDGFHYVKDSSGRITCIPIDLILSILMRAHNESPSYYEAIVNQESNRRRGLANFSIPDKYGTSKYIEQMIQDYHFKRTDFNCGYIITPEGKFETKSLTRVADVIANNMVNFVGSLEYVSPDPRRPDKTDAWRVITAQHQIEDVIREINQIYESINQSVEKKRIETLYGNYDKMNKREYEAYKRQHEKKIGGKSKKQKQRKSKKQKKSKKSRKSRK
jgi:hypothetical protein